MRTRTRQLLRALANESADGILGALGDEEWHTRDLATAAKMPERTVAWVLRDLQRFGIVRERRRPTGERGLTPKVWHLARGEELAAFTVVADELVQRLLDREADEHRHEGSEGSG